MLERREDAFEAQFCIKVSKVKEGAGFSSKMRSRLGKMKAWSIVIMKTEHLTVDNFILADLK